MIANTQSLSKKQVASFKLNGYLKIPHWLDGEALSQIQQSANAQLANPTKPWELEAERGYPGSPITTDAPGGLTPRRLLGAYQRDGRWREFATSCTIKRSLQQLFNSGEVFLSQAHHNCLMTKSPKHSSDTGWHQDSRYWSFASNNLITAWLALGEESHHNGGLMVVPASHTKALSQQKFDRQLFFKSHASENKEVLQNAKAINLQAGDLLFFHCNLLHRAGRNLSEATKLSLVFTYYSGDNHPVAGTRSASCEVIAL